jgi:glycosyltransferase involved in cell wall biosynthesis
MKPRRRGLNTNIITVYDSNVFNISQQLFDSISIPEDTDIVVVSDMFVEDYVGGAELTTQALIDSSPFKVFKLHSKDLTIKLLQEAHQKFWIFGNWTQMNMQLIPTIVGNIKYAVLEYDYKYCKYRSPEIHFAAEQVPCDCHNQMHGKMVSAFFLGAQALYWMSEAQQARYHTMFPFLAERDNIVLSSVLSAETLAKIKVLRELSAGKERSPEWVVLGSNSPIKGYSQAMQWAKDNDKPTTVVWNKPYNELLATLAACTGLVYLPMGADTCPRLVIEAKLLGCQLQLNNYVQHKDEEWFATDNLEEIEQYLYAAPGLFWNSIKKIIDYVPSISGYTTTYNCKQQGYPFRECIESMLQFCDEVCVVDGGSTDGTWSVLQQMALGYQRFNEIDGSVIERLKVKQIPRDWAAPRHAIFDGMQKAEARKMCTKEFCWQMDSDEIVHEDHVEKVKEVCRSITSGIDVVCLPVVEYWGSADKVRIDVTPWKWRLTRNKPYITHGIPRQLRAQDDKGELYARPGTDGCDLIHTETGDPIPHITFWNAELEGLRQAALNNQDGALQKYQEVMNQIVRDVPSVFHYSWYDMERKIRLYRDYWQNHWNDLYNKSSADTAENNMFFGVPWADVTDEMIKMLAISLSALTGGHVFHSKWTGQHTPSIKIAMSEPKIVRK